jgi:hypothetical protein
VIRNELVVVVVEDEEVTGSSRSGSVLDCSLYCYTYVSSIRWWREVISKLKVSLNLLD